MDESKNLLREDAYVHLKKRNTYVCRRTALLQHFTQPNKRIVEWGCAEGDVLAALAPATGCGVDIDEDKITAAQSRYKNLEFQVADITQRTESPEKAFDYIIFDLLVGVVSDVQASLEQAQKWAHPRTRLLITAQNNLYGSVDRMSRKHGRDIPPNWLSLEDLNNLLELAGWEIVTSRCEILCPVKIPLLDSLLNRWLVRLPFFRHLGTTILVIARPKRPLINEKEATCSVIVPARNEAGNILNAIQRIPPMGAMTEIIFVEGNSKDNTWQEIQDQCKSYSGPLKLSYIRQPGIGKWDAVKVGFEKATGDILVIQDGDLTAPPEDLEKFYLAVTSGMTEFANGSRLVYPMEEQAMRYLNLLGNKAFALSLSYVLGQQIKDSLCGTKMLLRSDYKDLIDLVEKRLGDFDPFGDFNLLFGSAMLGLRIRDIPVRYKDRVYGQTNISRFRHGMILFRMTWIGMLRIHFFKYSL